MMNERKKGLSPDEIKSLREQPETMLSVNDATIRVVFDASQEGSAHYEVKRAGSVSEGEVFASSRDAALYSVGVLARVRVLQNTFEPRHEQQSTRRGSEYTD